MMHVSKKEMCGPKWDRYHEVTFLKSHSGIHTLWELKHHFMRIGTSLYENWNITLWELKGHFMRIETSLYDTCTCLLRYLQSIIQNEIVIMEWPFWKVTLWYTLMRIETSLYENWNITLWELKHHFMRIETSLYENLKITLWYVYLSFGLVRLFCHCFKFSWKKKPTCIHLLLHVVASTQMRIYT